MLFFAFLNQSIQPSQKLSDVFKTFRYFRHCCILARQFCKNYETWIQESVFFTQKCMFLTTFMVYFVSFGGLFSFKKTAFPPTTFVNQYFFFNNMKYSRMAMIGPLFRIVNIVFSKIFQKGWERLKKFSGGDSKKGQRNFSRGDWDFRMRAWKIECNLLKFWEISCQNSLYLQQI